MSLCGLLDLPRRKEGKSVIYIEAGLQDLYCLVRKPSLIGDQCLGPNIFHAPESPPTRCKPNGSGNTILLHQKYLIKYFLSVYVAKLCRNSNEFKIKTRILKPRIDAAVRGEHKRVPSLGPEIVFWTRTKKPRVFPTTRTQAISDQL